MTPSRCIGLLSNALSIFKNESLIKFVDDFIMQGFINSNQDDEEDG